MNESQKVDISIQTQVTLFGLVTPLLYAGFRTVTNRATELFIIVEIMMSVMVILMIIIT